jgi:hypothetical protein
MHVEKMDIFFLGHCEHFDQVEPFEKSWFFIVIFQQTCTQLDLCGMQIL